MLRQEGSNVRYFYHDGDRIIAEREGNSWVVRYLLGLKPCGFISNGQIRIYHADRLGSVRWVTDGSQNIVASYVYEGFGKIVGQNGGGGGPYQFCGLWGYRNDNDAGLLHVGARYYEVETGRWVQKDSSVVWDIKNPQALNQFSYCENSPIGFIDPCGKRKTPPSLSEALMVIGGIIAGFAAILPPPASGVIGAIGAILAITGGIIWMLEHSEPISNPVYGSGQLPI